MPKIKGPLDKNAVRIANAALRPETGGRLLSMKKKDYAFRKKWASVYYSALHSEGGPGPLGTSTSTPSIDPGTLALCQSPSRDPVGMAEAVPLAQYMCIAEVEPVDGSTSTPYLLFNGTQLTWVENNIKVISWPAVSGREGYQSPSNQKLKNKGPLPAGKWLVKQSEYQKMASRSWIEEISAELGRTAWPGGQSSWGKNRIWIHPAAGTDVFNRSGFSIHGGDSPGSAGCIDLTNHMPDFIKKYLQYGKDMILEIDYDKDSASNK